MSYYRFPYKDAGFLLNDLLDFDQMCLDAGRDDVNYELASAILEEAGRLGSEVLAPLNTVGDELGAKLEDNGVHETPGFSEAYRQYVDNGWASLAGAEQYGGQAMPRVLASAVVEVWDSACVAFSLCGLLTTGAVEAVMRSFEQKGQPIDTPHLEIAYQAKPWKRFRESGRTWDIITPETPQPTTFQPRSFADLPLMTTFSGACL